MSSAVEVKVPRVKDMPAEVSPVGFESKIVRLYERTSRQTQDLFRKLHLEGLSTVDFRAGVKELLVWNWAIAKGRRACPELVEGAGQEC